MPGTWEDTPIRCIAAVWGDGKVVWSSDALNGGAPYFMGNIETNEIKRLDARVHSLGVIGNPEFYTWRWGPDEPRTVIYWRNGERRLCMEASANSRYVQRPDDVKAGQLQVESVVTNMPLCSRYSRAWWAIRSYVQAMLPAHGSPSNLAFEVVNERSVVLDSKR